MQTNKYINSARMSTNILLHFPMYQTISDENNNPDNFTTVISDINKLVTKLLKNYIVILENKGFIVKRSFRCLISAYIHLVCAFICCMQTSIHYACKNFFSAFLPTSSDI